MTMIDYRAGKKPLHEYLLDNATAAGDRTACVFYGTEISWQALADSTRRLAQYLADNGVAKGDRVGLYLQNCPQYLIAHFAIQMIGAIVSPLNPQYKSAEVQYQLDASEACAVITDRTLYQQVAQVRDQVPSLRLVITTAYSDYLPATPTLPVPDLLTDPAPAPRDTTDLLDILQHSAPLAAPVPVDLEEDICLMTFTSGTTGRPKGAMLSYGSSLYKNAGFFTATGMEIDSTSLAIAPFCHIAGMCTGPYMTVYGRLTAVILARFDAETAIQAFEKYRCSLWYSIAPMNRAILDHPGIEERDLSSLKLNPATSFGIPVTEALAEEWRELTGCQMAEAAYGLSETHTWDTYMPRDAIRWGSCGRPIPGNRIRILDPATGEPVASGETGEITVSNPAVFKGYWRRPEATAETLRDGWVHTGDIGYLDEEGYLYFNGRIKEMIKCSGYSVFPEDVEALMMTHPAIAQSAAVGVPDEKRGESVKLFVVLKPEYRGKITESQIIDWANEHMATFKSPRFVEFRNELPATGAGKLLRRLLREE